MTREEATKVRAEFNRALARELESHLSNGSEFIYRDWVGGEEPPADVVKLREQILKGVARALRFRGGGR